MRLTPGIGTTCSPCARSQASATCARLAPFFSATERMTSTMARFAGEVLFRPARIVSPPVVGGQFVAAAELTGEEPAAKRAVRHEADPELTARGEDVVFDIALPDRIFALQRRDRVDRVSAAQGLRAGLRQPEVTDLTFGDQIGHGAHTSSIGTAGSTRC
jgi:hypothetical protein